MHTLKGEPLVGPKSMPVVPEPLVGPKFKPVVPEPLVGPKSKPAVPEPLVGPKSKPAEPSHVRAEPAEDVEHEDAPATSSKRRQDEMETGRKRKRGGKNKPWYCKWFYKPPNGD